MQSFNWKNLGLSIQHTLAMFGGTILIPILMGLPPSLGLFSAGVATLIYHFITKNKIPIFMGSSAAYLAAFLTIKGSTNLATAMGAFVGAAFTFFLLSGIVALIGYKKVTAILPKTVAGSIIIVIGITLVPVALMLAESNYLLAMITGLSMIVYCLINKGPFKLFPVLLAIITGYLVAISMGLVNFGLIAAAPWFTLPALVKPVFNFGAMQVMAVVAFVAVLEHIGELTTNGMIVGNNHFENPGLHRSLFGDGIAILLAGIFGAVPVTTYGENTGVLAITKNFNPRLIRNAGIIAILLSFIGKFGAILASIPMPVVGGVSFVLFGMITTAGITTLKEADVNLMDFKNAVVVFLPIFIGVASVLAVNPLQIVISSNLTLSGLSLAALVGIILNIVSKLIDKFLHKNEER